MIFLLLIMLQTVLLSALPPSISSYVSLRSHLIRSCSFIITEAKVRAVSAILRIERMIVILLMIGDWFHFPHFVSPVMLFRGRSEFASNVWTTNVKNRKKRESHRERWLIKIDRHWFIRLRCWTWTWIDRRKKGESSSEWMAPHLLCSARVYPSFVKVILRSKSKLSFTRVISQDSKWK